MTEGYMIVPTDEMAGKGLKRLLPMVISIAIPFAAPAIASAIGLSGAISGMVGSTAIGGAIGGGLTGAVLGAAGGALTGQPIGASALSGALGGGFAGFMAGHNGLGAAAAGGPQAANPINGQSVLGKVVGDPSGAAVSTGAKQVVLAPSAGSMATGGIGSAVSANSAGIANGVSVASTLGAGQGVMSSLARLPGQMIQQMGGMDRALALVTRMAAQGVTGDPYMQDAIDQRRAELEAERQRDQKLYDFRLGQAERLLGEANYFTPEEGGRRAALDVTQRVSEQSEESNRRDAARGGYNTGRRRANTRRAGLGAGRGAAQAFYNGADTYQNMRLNTISAARQWVPEGSPQYASAQSQLDQQQRGVRSDQIDEIMGLGGFVGGASPYRPSEDEQWDRVGLWTGGRG